MDIEQSKFSHLEATCSVEKCYFYIAIFAYILLHRNVIQSLFDLAIAVACDTDAKKARH